MKRVFLLLCTLICASQLYGMEPLYEPKEVSFLEAERINQLHKEVKQENYSFDRHCEPMQWARQYSIK